MATRVTGTLLYGLGVTNQALAAAIVRPRR